MKKIWLIGVFIFSPFSLLAFQNQFLPQFEPIHFQVRSQTILPEKTILATLKNLEKFLETNPIYNLILEGHCDKKEHQNDPNNEALLSLKRAAIIKEYLLSRGIPSCRFQLTWRGSEKPFLPNTDDENLRHNRRVEITPVVNESNNVTLKYIKVDEKDKLLNKNVGALLLDYQTINYYNVNRMIEMIGQAIAQEPDLLIVICSFQEISPVFKEQADYLREAFSQTFSSEQILFDYQPCRQDEILIRIFDRHCKDIK